MKELKKYVSTIWGEAGQQWLLDLPNLIALLAEKWSLTDIRPVENMTYNYVAKAIQYGRSVVLKVGFDDKGIAHEYEALRFFNGQGMIPVLDVDLKHNAFLLAQAVPGETLKKGPSTSSGTFNKPDALNDSSRIAELHCPELVERVEAPNEINPILAYAKVVTTLAKQSDNPDGFRHVSKWCEAIDRAADSRLMPYLDRAKELRDYLLSSMTDEIVCHGDLHLENIISDQDDWIAIDPKGIIGETAFEAAWFNLHEVGDIAKTIQALAKACELDYERLLAWVFVRQVISAQWFIEDNLDPKRALLMLERLEPLLGKRYIKNNVSQTYDVMAGWYCDARSQDLFEKPYLDKLITNLPEAAQVLDLGCGAGQPIAEYLLKQDMNVTGVEGSKALVQMAQKNVPEMETIHLDMRHINFDRQFDAIVAWNSFFHLPKDDQRAMFGLFEKHLNTNGILVFTSGPDEGEVWSDNGGEMLYHASLSTDEYQQLFAQHHFEVLCHHVEDPECGDATVWMVRYLGEV